MMEDSHVEKYDDALNAKWKVVDVPLRIPTDANFKEYGRLVRSMENEEVMISQWPAPGRRKLYPGTGVGVQVVHGVSSHTWKGDRNFSHNKAVEYGSFCSGRLPADVSPSNRTHVLVREANYHPDSGQVWFPAGGEAFVMLLAPPGDDITPTDFTAFYFDGSHGLQVKAGVWHQPPFQLDDTADIKGKQGSVFACVMIDTAEEFETFLRVPIKPELATA